VFDVHHSFEISLLLTAINGLSAVSHSVRWLFCRVVWSSRKMWQDVTESWRRAKFNISQKLTNAMAEWLWSGIWTPMGLPHHFTSVAHYFFLSSFHVQNHCLPHSVIFVPAFFFEWVQMLCSLFPPSSLFVTVTDTAFAFVLDCFIPPRPTPDPRPFLSGSMRWLSEWHGLSLYLHPFEVCCLFLLPPMLTVFCWVTFASGTKPLDWEVQFWFTRMWRFFVCRRGMDFNHCHQFHLNVGHDCESLNLKHFHLMVVRQSGWWIRLCSDHQEITREASWCDG
jgi:hypothetical protein